MSVNRYNRKKEYVAEDTGLYKVYIHIYFVLYSSLEDIVFRFYQNDTDFSHLVNV